MAKKVDQFEGQGALFSERTVSSAETDPLLQSASYEYQPVPEGVYEDTDKADVIPIESDPNLVNAVKEAVKTQHRRSAQIGKHSPLERDGSYLNVQVGDFLPNFGPVTYRNFERAEEYARELEQQRKQ